MPNTLPHTANGFAQTAAEHHFREQLDDEARLGDDPTTLTFEGAVALADEDVGADPYNRTGRFRRLVR
jgi:hypothetical protein